MCATILETQHINKHWWKHKSQRVFTVSSDFYRHGNQNNFMQCCVQCVQWLLTHSAVLPSTSYYVKKQIVQESQKTTWPSYESFTYFFSMELVSTCLDWIYQTKKKRKKYVYNWKIEKKRQKDFKIRGPSRKLAIFSFKTSYFAVTNKERPCWKKIIKGFWQNPIW